ncbi:hypothetical protein [Flavobacterium sp. 245]|uniref:hypothetical protein n=1 Tax=Flavobacterium sp. 245 TaxID=2512115 RepID=UPI00105B93CD|nr:hypothetical protein [Flavobacterium sp. 245]TDP01550.1 peptidase M41-like protein [Flavobacterium sp. 245]
MSNTTRTAYHEAGHALMSYITGWSIKSVILKFENEELIYGLTTYNFNDDEINTQANLNRRILCLLGGPISQAIYENNSMLNIDTLGKDGENIDYLLSHLKIIDKENFIRNSIKTTATILQINENKKALKSIAEKLINDHQLFENDFIQLLNKFNITRMNFDNKSESLTKIKQNNSFFSKIKLFFLRLAKVVEKS